MKKTIGLSIILALISSVTFGSVIIIFQDTGTFDNAGVGTSSNITDGTYSFTMTTVDIIGTNGTSVVNDGATHTTSIQVGGGAGQIGVNSEGTDSPTSFENGESWIVAFSQDITFDSIQLASLDSTDEMQITILDGSNDGAGYVQTFSPVDGNTSPSFDVNQTVLAGTHVKFSAVEGSLACRIQNMTVTAIPEPMTMSLMSGALAAGFFLRKTLRKM